MHNFDISHAAHLVAVALVPALLGIILHEVAHGWMAGRLGDPTARLGGRLTLNPLPHIDPMGLAVFCLTALSGAFVFGWAKPVPVDPRYFRNPRKGMMLVALAGPCANFMLAVAFGLGLWLAAWIIPALGSPPGTATRFAISSLQAGVIINFGLGWLNLLPVPPLDGSKILAYFLPYPAAVRFLDLGRYGFIILLLLLATGLLGQILGPLVRYSSAALLIMLGF